MRTGEAIPAIYPARGRRDEARDGTGDGTRDEARDGSLDAHRAPRPCLG
jgi:hypothetical protein